MMQSPSRKRVRDENSLTQKAKKFFEELGVKHVKGHPKIFYKCKECSADINGSKPYNLVSHLNTVHPGIHQSIAEKQKDKHPVKRLKLLQNIVEIVAVNGRPFKYILDSGFQSIIQNKQNKLNRAGCGLNLHDKDLPEVKKHLHEMAIGVREKIKKETRARPLALLVDIVTKNRRSIFGVSIQYIINGELKVRSIGMIELLKPHTGIYLAEIIYQRLKVYEIDLRQILTITTDNGANVLKMVNDVGEILHNTMGDDNLAPPESPRDSCDFQSDMQTDDEISKLLSEVEELTDEDALEILFDDVLSNDKKNLLTVISNHVIEHVGLEVQFNISGVKCSEHTLQLGITDALKKCARQYTNVIILCRNVAKSLRTKSTQHTFETNTQGQYRTPRLDVETRWGSTYMMVSFVFNIFRSHEFSIRYMYI